jgi:hypothetical protein
LLVLILGLSMAGGALLLLVSSDPWGGGRERPGEIDEASRARLERVLSEADRLSPGNPGRGSASREKADR